MSNGNGKPKTLGIFALAMINVAAVLSLRNYSAMSVFGWSSIGWYLIGTITFLLPLTLAGAELATGWPKGGGVFAWVKEAFGDKPGFIAIFCEWSNNLVWFPTILGFIASTFAFALNPSLANNGLFVFVVTMIVFWGTTLVALLGEKASSRFQTFGVIAGKIIPGTLIILMGVWFLTSGKPIQLPAFTMAAIVPTVSLSTLPLISTMTLMFSGMEMAGFHALAVRNPQKDFPRGMLLSALIIFIITVLGTLAIAIVVPLSKLNLAAGVMQAFQDFLAAFNLSWLLVPLAILVALGGIASLTSWLIGPALGLGVVAREGNMPRMFSNHNRNGAPTGVLIVQAVIGSIISLLYIFIPSVSSAYWVMSALTVLLLCIVYLFVFASVIKLRYSQPDVPRAFRIPGGKAGVWIVGGVGFVATALSFVVSLFPTGSMNISLTAYMPLMLIGTALLALPPLVFLKLKKSSWKRESPATEERLTATTVPQPVAR